MNYEQAMDWLNGFQRFGIKLGLERIKILCERLGNPQKNYRVVHVGGTNGKGSVCRCLGSILTAAGYKTGVYLSPHLQRFTERFLINDEEISEEEIVDLVKKIKPIILEMQKQKETPTYFEIVTAMCFQHFKNEKVDFAVIEVGLGGRFDATNIVKPEVCVITNVSLEHQDRLGKTIGDIAFEKAGIIKNNIPVVTGAADTGLDVIKKIALEKKSEVITITDDDYKRTTGNLNGQIFLIHGKIKDYNVKTKMIGEFQGFNIGLAVMAVEQLQMNGLFLTDENIYDGVLNTSIPGRMEITSQDPFVLLDGAHNIEGIRVLVDAIKKDFICDRLILVLGSLSDKNIREMVEIIAPISDVIIVTRSSNPRACNSKKLKKIVLEVVPDKEVIIRDKILDAVNYAKSISKNEDLICVTGSLFTVAEAKNVS